MKPDQIKEQERKIKEHYTQLEKGEEPPTEPAPEEPPVEPAPEEPPVEPVADAPPAEPATGEPSDVKPPKEETAEHWKQKFKTLQGTFNAKMPELQHDNKQLTERVQQLESVLSQLQEQTKEEPKEEPLITADDVKEFGEETIDVIKRAAREEVWGQVSGEFKKLHDQIESMKQQTAYAGQTAEQVQRRNYEQELAAHVPDWQNLNQDPDFISWLLQIDPGSGIQKKELLIDAYNRLDVARTSWFFNQWKQEQGITAQPASKASKASDRKSELAHQISPGKGKTSTPDTAAQDQIQVTPDMIRNFFADKAHGVYRGREEEAKQIEEAIFKHSAALTG